MRGRLVAIGAWLPVRVFAWLALLGATGWLVRGEILRMDVPEGVKAFIDLVYREDRGRRLRLDVYVPDGPPTAAGTKRPALVAIHGGGWRGGSKTDYGRSVASLARHGLVVVAVDYRLSTPAEPSWPGNLDDVRAAIGWVRGHADEFAIDPDRLAVMGASAGGHLALLAGTAMPGEPARVRAVIDFYGPTDLRALYARRTRADRAIGLLLGGPPEFSPARYEAASPLRRVTPSSPPVLIVHGSDDALIPLDQSLSLAETLASKGVPHRLVTVADARHGFGMRVGARDLVPDILAFLEGVWGGSGVGVVPGPSSRRS